MPNALSPDEIRALTDRVRLELADPGGHLTWQRRLQGEGGVIGLEAALGDESEAGRTVLRETSGPGYRPAPDISTEESNG